jgi:drug/metabolite transporter (DMT)-like permease
MSETPAEFEPRAADVRPVPTSSSGIMAIVVVVLTFSSSSSIVRLSDAAPTAVAFWRMAIAVVLWFGWMLLRGIRISPAQWRRALLPGILFGVNIGLFFVAITKTSIAHAEFIGGLAPLFVVPIGARLFGEHIAAKALAWAAVAVAGMALVLFTGPPSNSATVGGDLITLLAVGTWTGYVLLTKANRGDMDVVQYMGAITAIALVVLAPYAIATGDALDVPAHGWISIAALGVLTGVMSHGLIVFAQQHLPVAMISILQVAQPALAVGWSYVLIDEHVDVWQLVGGGVVVVSLALFVVTARRIAAGRPRVAPELPAVQRS